MQFGGLQTSLTPYRAPAVGGPDQARVFPNLGGAGRRSRKVPSLGWPGAGARFSPAGWGK